MAILSPLKSRRLRTQKGDNTQQMIVFPIKREWFALPIFAVKKVIPKSDTHGDYHTSGTGLTVYEGRELLVLDISHQVFGNRPIKSHQTEILAADISGSQQPEQGNDEYLLIIHNCLGNLVGLSVQSSPMVRRFSTADIVPLPSNYTARVNIQCVSGLIVQSDNQPILFLLNPDQLLQTQPLFPPS